MHIQKLILKSSPRLLFWEFSQSKKWEIENILISEENYKDLTIYFTRYVHSKSKTILSLHDHEVMEKIEEHKGKNISWLMIIYKIKYHTK